MDNFKTVGLALGGGSALGFAHLGVLQVFEEEKIPVDMIAGCSMGSLLGGIYASGCSLKKLIDFARVFNSRKYIDLTLPFINDGYLRGDKVDTLINTMTQGISIEQTKIPFACIATCIEDAAPVYFTSGSLHDAIRASISMPGIFSPVVKNGKTYVDGGVWDRSAVSVLTTMNPEMSIAVNVSYCEPPIPTPDTARKVMMDSYEIISWNAVKHYYNDVDVVITPDTKGMSGNNYSDENIDIFIKKGAEAATEKLPQIRRIMEERGISVRL